MALAQINRAIEAEKERDRITATEKVIDRVEGKAPQTINQTNTNREIRLEYSIADVMEAGRKLGLEVDAEMARLLVEKVVGIGEE